MSRLAKQILVVGFNEATNRSMIKYHFDCDTVSDLPTLAEGIAQNVDIAMTSTAHIIETDEDYEMKSNGIWVKQKGELELSLDAAAIDYDNTTSGMAADNLQDAIDEIHAATETQGDAITELQTQNTSQQNEINYAINTGVKNLIKLNPNTYTSGNVVVKLNDDGTVSVSLSSGSTANTTFSRAIKTITDLRDMDLILNGCPSGGNYSSGYALYISDDGTTKGKDEGNGVLVPKNTAITTSYLALIVRSGTAISGTLTFKPMIRPAAITDNTFVPYALPNPTLTPAAIKAVDEGAKNLCNVDDFPTTTAAWRQTTLGDGVTLPAGEYILSFTNITSDAAGTLMQLMFAKDTSFKEFTSDYYHIAKGSNTSIKIRLTGDTTAIRIYAGNSYTESQGKSLSFSGMMICTAADYAISSAFVPYAPTNRELYKMILQLQSTAGLRTVSTLRSAAAPLESEIEEEVTEDEER